MQKSEHEGLLQEEVEVKVLAMVTPERLVMEAEAMEVGMEKEEEETWVEKAGFYHIFLLSFPLCSCLLHLLLLCDDVLYLHH